MPYWGWILLIVGLSALAVAMLVAVVHHSHRRMPARQAAQGDPLDLSAPLPMHLAREQDSMTAGELEEERQREGSSLLRNDAAAYEIVRGTAANSPADIVTDLSPAEIGEVLFYDGRFWRVDAIEPAQSPEADGRLIVSLTTDEPRPARI